MSGGIVGVGAPDPGTGQLINRLANPPNIFEQAGQAAQGLNAVKEFAAQNALTDIYRQSIDPTTGQVDLGKFNALAQQTPAALYKFGQTMQQAGTGVGQEGQGTSAQLKAQLDRLNAVGQMMYPLLQQAASGPVPGSAVQTTLDQALKMGLITQQQHDTYSSTVAGMGNDARPFIWGANMGNGEALRLLTGSVSPTQTGTGTVFPQVSPGGAPSPATPVPRGPGVEGVDLTVGTQVIHNVPYNVANAIQQNPDLLRIYYPQQYKQMNPGDQVTVAPPAGGAPAPTTPPGHYPAPPASAPAPPAAPAPAPPSRGAPAPTPVTPPASPQPAPTSGPAYKQPPEPLPAEAGGVGLSPQPGYVTNVVEPSQKAATALVTAAKDTPNVAGLIQDMRAQVNQPGWNPGLGAQAGSTWRQVLDKVGINATGSTPDQQKMAQASYDEFSKDANLIASRQLGTLGNPSDARQSLAEAITPGMAQSKEGVLGISATLMGNQDAINRTNAAWQDAKAKGWSDGRHNEWLAKNWNATDSDTGGRFDPRVFWLADTEGNRDDQQKRFVSKIPKGQQAQFVKNLQYAKDQGWVSQDNDGAYRVVNP